MRIRRIEIIDFRKLGHLVIEGLEDGLNVLVGDNEAGKSTVLAALRAVLFERHRVTGQVAEAMQPFGQTVRPQVRLDFELGGKAFTLMKAFCRKPEAELIGPGERKTGDQVEERLSELLAFTHSGRGASQPEKDQGIYGLLWVEQGRAHQELGVGAGLGSIASALEAEVGQVVGGERGRLLVARAEARRADFWDLRAKPRGAYREAIAAKAMLEESRAALASEVAALDSKVGELERCKEALDRHASEDRLGRAMARVAVSRQDAKAADGLRGLLEAARASLERLRSDHASALEARARRFALAQAVDAARRVAAEVAAEAELARGQLDRQLAAVRLIETQLAEALAARDGAETRLRRLERVEARERAHRLFAELDQRLRAASEQQARHTAALAVAKAIIIGREDVEILERLEAEHQRAVALRDAASVHIRFDPEGGQGIVVDGVSHDAREPLRLGRDASIALGGFGTLSIHPGGGVEALSQGVDEAQRRLAERLRSFDLVSVQQARETLDRRTDAEREAETLQAMVTGLAPEGLDALRLAVETQRKILAAEDPLEAETPGSIDEARASRQVATTALGQAEATASAARQARERAAGEAATLAERARASQQAHAERLGELTRERARLDDATLEESIARASEALAAADEAHRCADLAFNAARPDVAALALDMAERAQAGIAADIERLTRDKLVLETQLDTLGQHGFGEQLAETEDRLAAAAQHLEAVELKARASRLLHETLLVAQRETKERWLGPVRERVKPYLKLIHPDSEIELDEDTLELKSLFREGVAEPFERLSVGAREQVAVITRLALADLLRSSGRPAAVILDDALVNTDEKRLERMHLVLHQAARSLQILVLTCRERDFIGLGAPLRRI